MAPNLRPRRCVHADEHPVPTRTDGDCRRTVSLGLQGDAAHLEGGEARVLGLPGLAAVLALQKPRRDAVVVVGMVGGAEVQHPRVEWADREPVGEVVVHELRPGGAAVGAPEQAARPSDRRIDGSVVRGALAEIECVEVPGVGIEVLDIRELIARIAP